MNDPVLAAGTRLPYAPAVIAVATAAALTATAAPLLVYALSLAVLGAPHVLAELRYVDGRFARRLGRRRGLAILGVLAGIVAVRFLMLRGRIAYDDGLRIELGAVAALAFAVLFDFAARPRRLALAVLGAAALRDAQRAWIAFRDRACEVEGMRYEGGSIQPMIVAGCLERLTRARSEDLRLLAEDG